MQILLACMRLLFSDSGLPAPSYAPVTHLPSTFPPNRQCRSSWPTCACCVPSSTQLQPRTHLTLSSPGLAPRFEQQTMQIFLAYMRLLSSESRLVSLNQVFETDPVEAQALLQYT